MTETIDNTIEQGVNALPKEIAPPRDLWPGIEAAIEARANRRAQFMPRYAIASVLCCALLSTWFIFKPANNADSELPGNDNLAVDLAAIVTDMDRGFEVKRASLLAKVKNDVAHTTNWKQQISELESARQAIKESIEEDPENLYLIRILQSIHEQQLSLIENVHQQVNQNSI